MAKEINFIVPATNDDKEIIHACMDRYGEGNVREIRSETLSGLISEGDFWLGIGDSGEVGAQMAFQKVGVLGDREIREVRSVVIHPDFRGNGAVQEMFSFAQREKYADSQTIFFGVTKLTSVGMQKGFQKLGFRLAYPIEVIGIFGIPENQPRDLSERVVWLLEP